MFYNITDIVISLSRVANVAPSKRRRFLDQFIAIFIFVSQILRQDFKTAVVNVFKCYWSTLRWRSCCFVTECVKATTGEGDGFRRHVSYIHFPPSPLTPSTTAPPPPQRRVTSRRRRRLLFTASGRKKKNVFTTRRDAAVQRDFLWPRLRQAVRLIGYGCRAWARFTRESQAGRGARRRDNWHDCNCRHYQMELSVAQDEPAHGLKNLWSDKKKKRATCCSVPRFILTSLIHFSFRLLWKHTRNGISRALLIGRSRPATLMLLTWQQRRCACTQTTTDCTPVIFLHPFVSLL